MNHPKFKLKRWLSQTIKPLCFAMAGLALATSSLNANAAQMEEQNLVQLMQHSQSIVLGVVTNVTDGFTADNIPYTEITLNIGENLKGNAGKAPNKQEGSETIAPDAKSNNGKVKAEADVQVLTFRQFGLLEPKKMPNGKTFMMTTPDGWATYGEGESVMLFLHQPASLTGLQTTAGLSQGKLSLINGSFVNSLGNKGLFEKVTITAAGLSPQQQAMLSNASPDFNAASLTDLVRRAVSEGWIESGVMTNEK